MKRLISFFLTAGILLSLPIFPETKAVQQVSESQQLLGDPAILDPVTEQFTAFAAAHYSPTAADGALDRLLEHGFYGKRAYLTLNESDPVLKTILNSALYRQFFLTCIPEALSTMQVTGSKQLLAGGSIGWESYGLQYQLLGFTWNETKNVDDDVTESALVGNQCYEGATNRHDDSLMLVVGGLQHRIHIRQLHADFDSVTYRLEMRFADTFSFDSDYSAADEKGFNTTFGKLLNFLGPLIGLKPYGWHVDTAMEITVPNLCTHASESYRWENRDGSLVSVSDGSFTANPLTTLYRKLDGKTTTYFAMETPVVLSPSQSWSVEFTVTGHDAIKLSASYLPCATESPFLLKGWNRLYIGKYYYALFQSNGKFQSNFWYTAYEAVKDGWKMPLTGTHRYRVENRISPDGTASIWLLVNGEEIGALTRHYQYDLTDETEVELEADPEWANSAELRLRYLFDYWNPCKTAEVPIGYLEIREGDLEQITVTEQKVTCLEGAYSIRSCSRCGAAEQIQTAPPAGHTEENLPGKAPSCTEDGLTDGSRCTVCGDITKNQQRIPATGHRDETLPGKAPTCTEAGLTDGRHCAACGTVISAQQPLSALGHRFETGLCVQCGQLDPDLLPGDTNMDGAVNYQDALLVLRYSIQLETLSPAAVLLSDMDNNGFLNYQDALLILRRSINLF